MFNPNVTTGHLNAMFKNTMMEHVGMEIIEVSTDMIKARMPVDHRTHQPYGLLHGGASAVLAETIGSIASSLIIDNETQICVGIDINVSHIKGIRSGNVYGTTKPVHIGGKIHVWEIRITNEEDELIALSKLTMAILDKRN